MRGGRGRRGLRGRCGLYSSVLVFLFVVFPSRSGKEIHTSPVSATRLDCVLMRIVLALIVTIVKRFLTAFMAAAFLH